MDKRMKYKIDIMKRIRNLFHNMEAEKLKEFNYDKLNEIGVELSLYSKYLHEALLTKFISDRLEASLRYYEIELDKTTS